MKDGEFNEKVPMVFALNKSTLLFNKGNYEKAIEILEEVLKQDPSMDFKESIRYDVWYNLSVNYILTKQYDKAYSAIIKFIKRPEYIQPGYRVFFNEVLTQSQKKMLMSNYRFERFKFYMDHPKYRKVFEFFVQELGNKLSQIENDTKEKKYTDVINELNLFRDIIVYFADIERPDVFSKESVVTYIFSNDDLVNIFNKVQELIKQYVDKEKESLLRALNEALLNAEEKIKKNLFSEAKIDFINLLDIYYNFQLGSSGSLVTDGVINWRLKETYNSDEKFKKIIDFLNLIKGKEEALKEKEINNELDEIERSIEKNDLNFAQTKLERIKSKIERDKFKNLERKIKNKLELVKKEKERQKQLEILREREQERANEIEIFEAKLKEISGKIYEYDFDVSLEVMYNLLLDFSNIFETPSGERIPKIDVSDKKYYIQGVSGPCYFEFIEKIPNKKLVYQYDFLNSPSSGEKGKLTIEFIEPSPGSVKLKVKNEIYDLKPDYKNAGVVLNLFGRLGPMINWILPKILAKQIHTIIYEKVFDDLSIGNYRILQIKLNAIGKDIDKLKAKYFEVKAPLTLNSFECSECGATLNITSKDEKFIICEHCSTPFLMEWQKGL